jgi:lysophospholipase L1-like esterase
LIFPATVFASFGKLGAMGDSLTDEYWDMGWSYAKNWPQLLVEYRGIDMGPTAAQAGVGTWGEPRNTGFKYNWARGGANSATLLTQGQHTGVAAQASSNGVGYAVLAIGPNDFNTGFQPGVWYGPYYNIYNGVWSAAQIQSHVAQSISNVETALAAVRAAGVSVVLVNVVDPGPTPAVASGWTSVANRDRVTSAIRSVNAGLRSLAQKYQVPLVDWFALETAMLGPNTNLHSTLKVGNVTINLSASDPGPPNSRPTNAFIWDGFHPNTVLQGILANTILQAFNSGYGAGVPLFSEQELLNQALIPYGGSDTLQAQIGSFTNYIVLPVLPRITSLTAADTNVTLEFSTVSNQTYLVERRDDLAAGLWTTVSSNIIGTGGIVTLTNQVPANLPQQFYRVRQLP